MANTARFAGFAFTLAVLFPSAAYAAQGVWYERMIGALIPEAPEMVAIARCESGLRQFTESGDVLRGGLGGKMIGLFQFHETYHRTTALAQGYNIDSVLGNIGYARELYRAQGTTPWRSSAYCWQQAASASVATNEPAPSTLTQYLRYGSTHPEVALLKDVLVARGFLTATAVETRTMFDLATLKALIAFQCAEKLACHTGTLPRTGIGRVSGTTLERLNEILATQTLARSQ